MHSKIRDVAQPGSVLAWGARGRWFESSHPDKILSNKKSHFIEWDFFIFKQDTLFLHHIDMSVMITQQIQDSIKS